MDRRAALKNMGMAFGYSVATPTLISLLQSCQSEPKMEWTPEFFSKEEGNALIKLVDIILPKTDTPSASEVQVHLFIDRFISEILPQEQKDLVRMNAEKFMEMARNNAGKESLADLEEADLEAALAKTLDITKEQEEGYKEAMDEYFEGVAIGETPMLDEDAANFSFASQLREMTIWAYKTSEYVGEKVLAYLPVPGPYVPCASVEELTGGKDWSIQSGK